MKDRNYWLERGKRGWEKSGYICIGEGNNRNPLKEQLKIEENHIWMNHDNEFNNYNCGNVEGVFYYLSEDKFNELFPEQKTMKYKIETLNIEHSKAIQTRLFELGYKWRDTGAVINSSDTGIIYLLENKTLLWFFHGDYKTITFDDLFKEDFLFKPIKVKLNSQYTAVVHKDKIVVGCQEFTMEVFEELKKAVDKTKE